VTAATDASGETPGPHGAPDPTAAPTSRPGEPSWGTALVTGASSGIGREIARQLAADATNLVVVARDRERLTELAAELTAAYGGVAVEVLAADLTDPAQLAGVEARVADPLRPVDLVVNNAGFATYGSFAELDLEAQHREIALNVTALVRLTHAALRGMLARGGGAVLNIASTAGLQATPGNATYGATKAFVASFGESLAGEVAGTGVSVTTVLPGYTRTEFHQRAGVGGRRVPDVAWMSAADVAAKALAAARAGKPWLVPGAVNKVLIAAAGPLPRGFKRRMAARVARNL
jgi:short-subunit dehydrogenase